MLSSLLTSRSVFWKQCISISLTTDMIKRSLIWIQLNKELQIVIYWAQAQKSLITNITYFPAYRIG